MTEYQSSYRALLAQADELRRQAEALRLEEAAAAIKTIKQLIDEYDLKPEDIGWSIHAQSSGSGPRRRKPRESRGKYPAKYKGPNGELWSGGAGRKPTWVKAALERGENLDQYLIGGAVDTTQQLDLSAGH